MSTSLQRTVHSVRNPNRTILIASRKLQKKNNFFVWFPVVSIEAVYRLTYLWNNHRHSISLRNGTLAYPNRMYRDQCNQVDIAKHPYPWWHSPIPSSLSYKCTFLSHNNHDRNMLDVDSRLWTKRRCFSNTFKTVLSIYWTVTFFTQFPFIAPNALTFAADTMTMTIAIGHFTFIMTQRTLLALPARIALAFTVNVFTILRAQHRTYTYDWTDSILIRSQFWFRNIE